MLIQCKVQRGLFKKYYNTVCFPSKILYNYFQFFLELTITPKRNCRSNYAKFWKENKGYYGIFGKGCPLDK